MRDRCLNPRTEKFAHYGGRGITICQRWLDSYANFLEDMGIRPINTTLDRINNDGGYSPDNCRWATMKEQQNNKRKHIVPLRPKASRPVIRRQATPKWLSVAQRDEMIAIYLLAKKLSSDGTRHEVDHIVPLRGHLVSGLHVPWNLQAIPATKNRIKGRYV